MEKHFDSSYLIPGTDAQTVAWYASLPQLGQESLELFEDEVVVVDTETTGLDQTRDQIIEIAACILRGPQVVDRFQTFVDPGFPIPEEIGELTGITDADVKGKPDPSLAVELFAQWADGRDLVAHNASFDRGGVMRQAVPGAITGEWFDSLAMARIILPRMRSHRLKDLAEAFCLPKSTHRAVDDVEATAQLWRILIAGAYTLPDGLAELIASLSPVSDWPLHRIFSQAALGLQSGPKWTLRRSRSQHVIESNAQVILDPEEERAAVFPTARQIEDAFSASGAAGRMYENYEPRREQLDMALEVTEALRTRSHRALEAGTGVGKSMAYLLPTALCAKANDITFGVATKTNALMDQLVYNELPRLDSALGGLRYVALKGYDHYPCLRKLESMARDIETHRKPEVIEMIAMLHTYTAQTVWGDLDAVNLHWWGLPRYAVEASNTDCLKNRCPFFPLRCYLHGARRHAKNAHIVVTNHALLFRNVKADNGILPTIKGWIVDEAHAVEAEARDQMSHAISARDLEAILLRLSGAHGTLAQIRRKSPELDGGVMLQGKCAEAQVMAGTIQNIATSFFSFVKDLAQLSDDAKGPQGYSRVTLWINDQVRASGPWLTLENPGRSLSKKLEALVDCLQRLSAMAQQFEELNSLNADLTSQHCSLWEMQAALSLVIEGSDKDYVYSATINQASDELSEELIAARIDVGQVLAEDFYPNADSVIYTSATLATGSSKPFAFFEHGCGLDLLDASKVSVRQMASSYDFDKNMKVLLPEGFPAPSDPSYRSKLAALVFDAHLAMGGSVLTLFTNRREMEDLYHRLKPQLAANGIELIAQTKGVSTKSLRDRFLEDRELCLFALKSFWEGFDAPGETLRCVIIPKLPFGRPNDPLSCERELREGRAAWGRYSLPEAVMDLKQAAGRLIRNSTDHGFLILADGRLQTKNYGKTFLKALPTNNIRTLPTDELLEVMRKEQ